MFLSDLSIKRPIMMTMFLLVFILFGALAYFKLPLDLMPTVDVPYVIVQTVYPGSSPAEVETQVTKKIEDAISTVSRIEKITSYSMESFSFIVIKFELDKEINIATQEVKDKIDAIVNDLPEDSDLPVTEKYDVNAEPIMDILLTGDMEMSELYDFADKTLKDQLSSYKGVAKVDLIGGQEREIQLHFDNKTIFENQLTISQFSQLVAANNITLPAGDIKFQSNEFSVRIDGEYKTPEEIATCEIPTPFGVKKTGQLARVVDTTETIKERTVFFNNFTKNKDENVILLSVVKSSDGNTVETAGLIKENLPELEKNLPTGCKLVVSRDASKFIEDSVDDTLGNIILGIILTSLVLLLFLHDLRSTLIIAISMPFSIISTFLTMQISDISLNIMSLTGLSTCVGILVANSVVVLENIFRHKEMGHDNHIAAGKGTAEIAIAIIASSMTNIVVFLPIASMSSLVGRFFQDFALTVTFATVFSIIVSFTLTPMMASLLLPKEDKKKHPIGNYLEKKIKSVELFYKKTLTFVLAGKKKAVTATILSVLLFIASLFLFPLIGFEFMPYMDNGEINIEMELPEGYKIKETSRLVTDIEEKITQYPEVKHCVTQIGRISDTDKGANMAKMSIKLTDVSQRPYNTKQYIDFFIRDLSVVPNAKIRVYAASLAAGSGEAPVNFHMQGLDMDTLETYKDIVIEKIENIPGLINLNTSSRPGKPEITIYPNRKKLADAGLTVYDLAMTVRGAIDGIEATEFKQEGHEYTLRLKLNATSVNSPEKIKALTVVSPEGKFRVQQLAKIVSADSYSKIGHYNKLKDIQITGYTSTGVPLGDITSAIDKALEDIDFPAGYNVIWAGDSEMMEEAARDMSSTFIIALILTYMLLAAILESFSQPLLILGTIPLAMIGVLSALFVTGLTLNIMSMLAIVMLIGVVVNNAILLLDYTNLLLKQGKNITEALIEACPVKLKPIIMTTVAIILGMLPMALGVGATGKEMRQPIGVVSIGGMLLSTILTLYIIPAILKLTHKSKK